MSVTAAGGVNDVRQALIARSVATLDAWLARQVQPGPTDQPTEVHASDQANNSVPWSQHQALRETGGSSPSLAAWHALGVLTATGPDLVLV